MASKVSGNAANKMVNASRLRKCDGRVLYVILSVTRAVSKINTYISLIRMKKWCPGAEFDAYPQRQFVTESININSLADHHIWSTIKTLPAT